MLPGRPRGSRGDFFCFRARPTPSRARRARSQYRAAPPARGGRPEGRCPTGRQPTAVHDRGTSRPTLSDATVMPLPPRREEPVSGVFSGAGARHPRERRRAMHSNCSGIIPIGMHVREGAPSVKRRLSTPPRIGRIGYISRLARRAAPRNPRSRPAPNRGRCEKSIAGSFVKFDRKLDRLDREHDRGNS